MKPHFTGGGKPRTPSTPPPRVTAPPRLGGGAALRKTPAPRYEYKEGLPIFTILLCVLAVGAGIFATMMLLPRDLSHIQGYGVGMSAPQDRNLYMESLPLFLERQGQRTFSEEEINHYLKTRIQGAQRGSFGGIARYTGVYVDIEPGEAEIFIERQLLGMRNTMSLRLVKNRFNNQLVWESAGGSIGRFSTGTSQFGPVNDAFKRLAVALDEEARILFGMRDVTLEKDRVTLSP